MPKMHKTIRMSGEEFAEKAEFFKSWKGRKTEKYQTEWAKKVEHFMAEHKAECFKKLKRLRSWKWDKAEKL